MLFLFVLQFHEESKEIQEKINGRKATFLPDFNNTF